MVKVVFQLQDGSELQANVSQGMTVLDAARACNAELEGACEGSLACSTCHVHVDKEWYDLLDPASDDEEDMLDLAFNLGPTSRLGCQIKMSESLDGLTVRLPGAK